MNYKERQLNQSLISRFLYKGDEREVCPKKIYHVDIISSHKYRTESMLKGSFFETLCLGRGAGNRIVDDLPRKKLTAAKVLENKKRELAGLPILKGDKTTDQIRIEEQATRFNILAAKYQITVAIENTQVRVVVPWDKNPDVYLSAEFDIFPTAIITNEGLKFALIDLKLTADINVTFGEYCWGAPEYLDPIQALMYHYIVREVIKYPHLNPHIKDLLTKPAVELIKKDGIEFYYWVFNYKKTILEDKLIKVKWDKTREYELHESINKTISTIDKYESLGWPTNPNYHRCKDCPVFECPDKQNIQSI
jgi:hypothetical protein